MNERNRLVELIRNAVTAYNSEIAENLTKEEFVADFLLASVIVPPFTIGQTIYIVDYFSNEIIEGKYQGVDCSKFENIFTTREDAEQALKEEGIK